MMDGVGLSSAQSLRALSTLLSPQEEPSEDRCNGASSLSPGSIVPPPGAASPDHVPKDSKDIWSEEEVAEGPQYGGQPDSRAQPEYDIVLKQSLGTEDVFLGLAPKDPSSMSCEAMVVKVHLPHTKAEDVLLELRDRFLDLSTPHYRLDLHLPQPVLAHGGTARFFSSTQELQVTLLLQGHLQGQ